MLIVTDDPEKINLGDDYQVSARNADRNADIHFMSSTVLSKLDQLHFAIRFSLKQLLLLHVRCLEHFAMGYASIFSLQ